MPARRIAIALAAGLWCLPADLRAQAEPLAARAAVGSQQVYVGQQFLLQIQVQGADDPEPIDVRPLERDFVVSEAGGGASNSTSVSIVNGRMTCQVRRGYNFSYRLAARREGALEIPQIVVTAAGRTARTRPVRMQVLPPRENSDFRFRLSLSEARAYVGQPLTLTATWYIGREVQEFSFTVPLLEDGRFEILEPPERDTQAQADVMEIRLGDRRALARKGTADLDGRRVTTLAFEKVLIPRAAGNLALPAATVTFATPRPGPSRRRDPFDDFFGGSLFSGMLGGRREMETLAIPSNGLRLEVLDLPSYGRPAGFNGWIGDFRLQADAQPTSVAVGEPITLGLTVQGTGMLPSAPFPDLHAQPGLARDFNVPREIGASDSSGGARKFTQTLRAKNDRVEWIPAVELPYFDPGRGAYRIARSEPIPIEVAPSRIVTAEDAEGLDSTAPRQLAVESSEQGLAHNYVDGSALEDVPASWVAALRPLGPLPLALALLALPPLVYFGALAARFGGALGNVARLRSRSPRAEWKRAVDGIDCEGGSGAAVAEAVLSALREYLGARLGGSPSEAAAWTFGDVERRLRERASARSGKGSPADEETLALLHGVFERCEAGSYAGVTPMDPASRRQLVADAAAAVDRVEGARR